MMKIVACATLLVAALVAVEAGKGKISERPGHENNLIERLGRFNQAPFTDLYKTYAAAFVLPKHSERARDDYRNYLPSGEECLNFFKGFRIDHYQLRDLEEFVILDACLGYVFANNNKDRDTETSDSSKELLEQLKDDEELKKLWENTRIQDGTERAKECVADLLLNVIVAKHQFPTVVCNNHFLQVFLQFAECQQGEITPEIREGDSYYETLYNLLKERVGACVDIEIEHIEAAVRLAYQKGSAHRLASKLKSPFSSLSKQSAQRMWPKEVTRLLAAVQNTTAEVNQREVHQLIRGVIVNDGQLKKRLLDHMALYADKTIKPAANNKAADADPQGINRYQALVDSLCNYFRSSDQESKYDFATPIIRLVQLLAHEDLFGISQEEFVTKMLRHAKESAPIYLSVQACNILTFTEGAIRPPTRNAKQHYGVEFRRDTKAMVLWPDAGFY